MKAAEYGSTTEIIRYNAGWLTPGQANAGKKAGRCNNCEKYIVGPRPGSRPGPYCMELFVATLPGATCRHGTENWF